MANPIICTFLMANPVKLQDIIKNLPCKSKPIIHNVSSCYNLRDAAALHHRDINEICEEVDSIASWRSAVFTHNMAKPEPSIGHM